MQRELNRTLPLSKYCSGPENIQRKQCGTTRVGALKSEMHLIMFKNSVLASKRRKQVRQYYEDKLDDAVKEITTTYCQNHT
jgi:hypothetical protein